MYENFEHKADVGIRGKGLTIEEAFQEAAKAMFSIEVDLEKVEKKDRIEIRCEAENLEELFVEWLNRLLAEASIQEMFFSDFKIESIKDNKLLGYAFGEKIDLEKHQPKLEVKAATYSQLKVEKKNNFYIAQCIVDV